MPRENLEVFVFDLGSSTLYSMPNTQTLYNLPIHLIKYMCNNDFRGFYSPLLEVKKVGCVQPMLILSCFSDYVFEHLS